MDKEERNLQSSLEFWQKIGSDFTGQKSLDYLLGLAKISESNKKYQITLDAINEIVVVYPSFPYANTEKSKILMMIGDWDQSLETAVKVWLSN
jgi:tetratricopeptide repeat protein 21B